MSHSNPETELQFFNHSIQDWDTVTLETAKGWDQEIARNYVPQSVEAQEALDKNIRLGVRPYAAVLMVLANGGK